MASISDYRVREYQSADLPSLAAIYTSSIRHLGAEYYSDDQIAAWSSFAEDMTDFERWINKATTFVAVDGHDECIGFAGIEDHGRIASLFVAPAFMRKGVASRLLMRLLDEARARRIAAVTTDASEFSRPLFEKFGLRVEEIEHIEFKGVELSRYAMRGSSDMRSRRPFGRAHPVWGWFCIALGLYAVAIATELLPTDTLALHAPMWVVFLCGVVFLLGGAMMLIDRASRLNGLCASLLLLGMAAIGAWVALLGPAAGFSGGIPFLPHEYNVSLARWVFGVGALVSFTISVYAIRMLVKACA